MLSVQSKPSTLAKMIILQAYFLPDFLTALKDGVTATQDMAMLSASGSSIEGPAPVTLPIQYLTNVETWLFSDSDTANDVKREFPIELVPFTYMLR